MRSGLLAGPVLLGLWVLNPGQIAVADEGGFLSRFDGRWTGGGPYRRNAKAGPVTVRCSLEGDQGINRMRVGGNCRAAIIVSRAIAADLRFDPRTSQYRGTYIGARGGTSQLVGRRKGDTIHLTVTWPRPLNGDRVASMAITNSGNGAMRLRVTDKVSPSGPTQVMSDLTFRKRSS